MDSIINGYGKCNSERWLHLKMFIGKTLMVENRAKKKLNCKRRQLGQALLKTSQLVKCRNRWVMGDSGFML